MTTARVLADSINSSSGSRLTTLEVVMHRFVLAEFNTHRVFSRNSASSRAIPVAKQIERVRNDPAIPVVFPAEQRGMQGGEGLSEREKTAATAVWENAADYATRYAEQLSGLGVHKSVVNRLLEPFMWHTVIVSSTDWHGFWHQRCSPLAQPEIRVAAEAMKTAYDASTPTALGPGHWHTPLIQPDEDQRFWQWWADEHYDLDVGQESARAIGGVRLRKMVSAARCARVSYLTHDGKRDIKEDLTLYDRLITADPGHWSPLEHVATPCPEPPFGTGISNKHLLEHLGNFTGWDQHRHEVEGAKR